MDQSKMEGGCVKRGSWNGRARSRRKREVKEGVRGGDGEPETRDQGVEGAQEQRLLLMSRVTQPKAQSEPRLVSLLIWRQFPGNHPSKN